MLLAQQAGQHEKNHIGHACFVLSDALPERHLQSVLIAELGQYLPPYCMTGLRIAYIA